MPDHGIPRCCIQCGRWGNRAFVQVDDNGGWVCANDRACRTRREHQSTNLEAGQ